MIAKFDTENNQELFWVAIDWLSRNRGALDNGVEVPADILPMLNALNDAAGMADPGPDYAPKPLLFVEEG
jgi:hypothetical protein